MAQPKEQRLAEIAQKMSVLAHALWLRCDLKPTEPYRTAKTPWLSIHKPCGEKVHPCYDAVRARGSYQCKHCEARFGRSYRRHTAQALALWEKKSYVPLVDYPGAGKPWLSIHTVCGEEISPTYNRVKNIPLDRGCRRCAPNAPVPEDVAWQEMREAGWEPLVAYPGGTNYRWLSRCTTCAEESSPALVNVRAGRGCQLCWYGRMSDLFRTANEPRVRAAFIGKGLTPVGVYQGWDEPWESICHGCGETTSPRPTNLLGREGLACHHCSDSVNVTGFWTGGTIGGLYLIEHLAFDLVKIGVFREGSKRLRNFKRAGWQEIKTWEGLDKKLVYRTEQLVLKTWAAEGIIGLVPAELLRGHGGHTEVVSRDSVNTTELMELLHVSLSSGG